MEGIKHLTSFVWQWKINRLFFWLGVVSWYLPRLLILTRFCREKAIRLQFASQTKYPLFLTRLRLLILTTSPNTYPILSRKTLLLWFVSSSKSPVFFSSTSSPDTYWRLLILTLCRIETPYEVGLYHSPNVLSFCLEFFTDLSRVIHKRSNLKRNFPKKNFLKNVSSKKFTPPPLFRRLLILTRNGRHKTPY